MCTCKFLVLLYWTTTVIYTNENWCKPVSETVNKNKEVIELEPWSRAYQEYEPIWACLGLQTKFWAQVQNLIKITLDILELQDYETSSCKNFME